jgi:hypothetical protein
MYVYLAPPQRTTAKAPYHLGNPKTTLLCGAWYLANSYNLLGFDETYYRPYLLHIQPDYLTGTDACTVTAQLYHATQQYVEAFEAIYGPDNLHEFTIPKSSGRPQQYTLGECRQLAQLLQFGVDNNLMLATLPH